VDWRPGRFATAARSLGGYARHIRKSIHSFVTIRKLLTRCGAERRLRMFVGSHAQVAHET
jgi:hypothetical protein